MKTPPSVSGTEGEWGGNVLAQIRLGVDAWICSNETIAWELMRFLLDQGIRIPDQVGIVGYHDGKTPDPRDMPLLTTVEISDDEIGAAALRTLVHRFEYPRDAIQSLSLAPKLLARATTRAEHA